MKMNLLNVIPENLRRETLSPNLKEETLNTLSGPLAQVAGDALSSKIPTILGALSDGMSEGDDPEVSPLTLVD